MLRTRLIALACLCLLAACDPGGGSGPGGGGGGGGGGGSAEPNVVSGRVTDAQGDPVADATITVAGYTGTGSNVVEEATTGSDGTYRIPVPEGLYDVRGVAAVQHAGQSFVLDLHPASGACEEAMSADGIVADFRLELSGLLPCYGDPDPEDYSSYSGATIDLSYAFPRSLPADAVVTVTLEPDGPLADGSEGQPLTFTRTVAALDAFAGPIEESRYLHDIPLGAYRISGTVESGGTTQALRFRTDPAASPSEAAPVGFEAVEMFPYGIRVTTVEVFDPAWSGG
jgi:hypothetical protein